MKKRLLIIIFALSLLVSISTMTGCVTADSFLKNINTEHYANSIKEPILQTDIKGISDEFLRKGHKVLLVMIEGMRIDSIEQFYDNRKGIARLATEGGLYFTSPAGMETKAKIGIGTCMLGILTGVEPAEMGVMKSTDAKRVEPYSMLAQYSKRRKVEYVTDYSGYLDTQLKQEIASLTNSRLKVTETATLIDTEQAILSAAKKQDVVVATVTEPFVKADGKYKLSNEDYLSAIFNVNAMIESLIDGIDGSEWLIMVTSTFGGEEILHSDKSVHNTTTFLAANRDLSAYINIGGENQ